MDIKQEREAFEAFLNERFGYSFAGGVVIQNMSKIDCPKKHELNYYWEIWQAAKAQAVPEGLVLVPVETLNEALSWANCASSESWSDAQREEIDKHYEVIENAMIEAQEQSND